MLKMLVVFLAFLNFELSFESKQIEVSKSPVKVKDKEGKDKK